MQYGFKVVIAPWREGAGGVIPGFADIFRNNSSKNGLLTVELAPNDVDEIFAMAETGDPLEATADLEAQTVTFHRDGADRTFEFSIDAGVKDTLLRGLDDIDLTLEHEDAIRAFEAQLPEWASMTAGPEA
jgi:3-isopropylmalate/(R)-2-methylmalate dehydratase small subunit